MSRELLFWNRGSGKADEVEQLRDAFPADTSSWVEMTRAVDLRETIADALHHGCETVVAAGGDGTVNALVNALMQIETEHRPRLLILPLGTANDFAGTLQIPDAVDQAVELMRTGRCIPVDVIRISGDDCRRYFVNVAAGGNSVRVSEAMTDELKQRWGAFSYLRGAIEVLPDMKTFRIDADCDGERFDDFDSWAVLVANGRTNAGHIEVAPNASPIDGLLDVIMIRDGDITDMVEIVANNLLGNFLESEQLVFRQVKKLVLHSTPAMPFSLDGEVIDEQPIEFQVIPEAIRMFVGTEFGMPA